jgi:AAA15 family ATPase/GTPase
MLKSLHVNNFTVFSEAEFNFGAGLNVFLGVNGVGKTHVLKLLYSILNVSNSEANFNGNGSLTKAHLQNDLARKLIGVFKPDGLGRLARRSQGRLRCDIQCNFTSSQNNIAFSFNTSSKTEVVVEKLPAAGVDKVPVYLPTRELLTIYPGFVSLYDNYHLPFEETWRDTCSLLGAPLVRGPREASIKQLLDPIEKAMNGSVLLTPEGKFYLTIDGDRTEMHLVAEGLRKLAMIARMIATGSLVDKGYLFWDEPEANENPVIIKEIARTILGLGQSGIQVFIATHSLFLVRELDILLHNEGYKKIDARFFNLARGASGVSVVESSSVDDVGDIASLDEELNQNDRYVAAVAS